jgi:L-aspartate oxidase
MNEQVIIIGTGIAGFSAAIHAAKNKTVLMITKDQIKDSSTNYAQGGIAAALSDDDSPDIHQADTLNAGAGLSNTKHVNILVNEGPQAVKNLIGIGANFDKKNNKLSFTHEAAHSKRRILHRADHTGQEIANTLKQHALKHKNITILENCRLKNLIVKNNNCSGIVYIQNNKHLIEQYCESVILATGGCGQLYQYNTNPPQATGDGISIAHQAGAVLKDLEFIQFHPTTLYSNKVEPFSPSFLISEAVRGEGAKLINFHKKTFMANYHPQQELAPRDIVSRAIFSEMTNNQSKHLYLDLSPIKTNIINRFPTIYKHCLKRHIDITKDLIPISPAAHYLMGGIQTDENGQSSVENLYAIGECACTGVHGANRLASNSLLEGLVFGNRAGKHAATKNQKVNCDKNSRPINIDINNTDLAYQINTQLKHTMWTNAGINRNQTNLEQGLKKINSLINQSQQNQKNNIIDLNLFQSDHMLNLASLIIKSALKRKKSLGAHHRTD